MLQQAIEAGIVLVLAAACVAVMLRRRWLSPRALEPARDPRPIGPIDVLIGFVLMLVGVMAGVSLLAAAGLGQDPNVAAPRQLTGLQQAVYVMVIQICTAIPPVAWLVGRVLKAKPPNAIGLLPRRLSREVAVGLLGLVLVTPVIMATHLVSAALAKVVFNHEVDPVAHTALRAMLDAESTGVLAIYLASAVILAPLMEELVYRGLIHNGVVAALRPFNRWWAVGVSAVLFTGIHIQGVAPAALPGLLVLSIALGWLYERTRSLWPGVFLHLLFNAGNIAWLFAFGAGGGNVQ